MKNNLKRIKDYFAYSRTERNGIIILFGILLLTIAFNILLPYFIKPHKTDYREFKEKILAFEKQQAEIKDSLNNLHSSRNNQVKNKKIKLSPFYFDPNKLSIEKWKDMGLQDWQIEVIKNYESKGGKFYKATDLSKIYSISPEEYEILEPYIRIANSSDENNKNVVNPVPFNPNEISKNDMLEMGLREDLVNTILNYRNKGGKFYSKEDFKKLYTLTNHEYILLEAYITLEDDTLNAQLKRSIFVDSLLVDINTADTLDLQQLKGIGPAFARRIVKYRDLLGGYYDIVQLQEVYGMDKSRYDGIRNHIYINQGFVQKININQASIKEMIKHPYIEFYIAKSIIAYRNEVGSITNLEEVKNIKLIYEELYQKIIPYLTIN